MQTLILLIALAISLTQTQAATKRMAEAEKKNAALQEIIELQKLIEASERMILDERDEHGIKVK